MKVVWTEYAFAQLDEAMSYIARDRPETAGKWMAEILARAAELADMAKRGRIVPEISREDIREILITPYRVIYRTDEDAVIITMVLHNRQLLQGDDSLRA